MARQTLVLLAVAAVVGALACHESPTGVPSTREDSPTAPAISADALAIIHDLVDDPLVHALVAEVDEPEARKLSRALYAVSEAAADGLPAPLHHALTTARHVVERDRAADDAVVQAAFGLVLDHANTMLDQARPDEASSGVVQEVR